MAENRAGNKFEESIKDQIKNPSDEAAKSLYAEAFQEMNSKSGQEDFRNQVSQDLNDGRNTVPFLEGFSLVDDQDDSVVTFQNKDTGEQLTFDAEGKIKKSQLNDTSEEETGGDGKQKEGDEGKKEDGGDGKKKEEEGEKKETNQPRVEEWGTPPRQFEINEDGTAKTEVKPGDTMWGIAKKICQERAEAEGRQVTNKEIAEEVAKIKKENPEIKDADVIHPGQIIKIPKDSVDSLRQDSDEDTEGGDKNGKDGPEVDRTAGTTEKQGMAKVVDYVQKNFKNIDSDGDGHITSDEIENAKKEAPKELQNDLEKFKQKIEAMEELSDDETGDENDGVTQADLDIASSAMEALPYAQQKFKDIDKDGDGYMTKEEIAQYRRENEGKLSDKERLLLEKLEKLVDVVQEFADDEYGSEDDGITQQDIAAAAKELAA